MPRRYAMEARNEESAARRQRVIDAAVEVLGEDGPSALTMESVAARADVATRTIYNHFSSREELIDAAHTSLLDFYRDSIPEDLTGGGEPREQLARFVQHMFDTLELQGQAVATLLAVRDRPAIVERVAATRAWRRREIERILRPARHELRLPFNQAVSFAFVMTNWNTFRGLTEETGLSSTKARAVATAAVRSTLFGD